MLFFIIVYIIVYILIYFNNTEAVHISVESIDDIALFVFKTQDPFLCLIKSDNLYVQQHILQKASAFSCTLDTDSLYLQRKAFVSHAKIIYVCSCTGIENGALAAAYFGLQDGIIASAIYGFVEM